MKNTERSAKIILENRWLNGLQGHGHKVLKISVSHVNAHQILGAMEKESKNNQVENLPADKATSVTGILSADTTWHEWSNHVGRDGDEVWAQHRGPIHPGDLTAGTLPNLPVTKTNAMTLKQHHYLRKAVTWWQVNYTIERVSNNSDLNQYILWMLCSVAKSCLTLLQLHGL